MRRLLACHILLGILGAPAVAQVLTSLQPNLIDRYTFDNPVGGTITSVDEIDLEAMPPTSIWSTAPRAFWTAPGRAAAIHWRPDRKTPGRMTIGRRRDILLIG